MKIFIFLLSVVGFAFYLQQDKKADVLVLRPQKQADVAESLHVNKIRTETDDVKYNIKNIETLTIGQLNEEIQKIELRLADFSDLSFENFTEKQLNEFNELVQKKAVYLKKYIFKKYSTMYTVGKL